MPWPIKKTERIFWKNPNKGSVIFDFYLNDQDVATGKINNFKKSKLLTNIKNDMASEKQLVNLRMNEREHNFGYSADWTLVIIEWLAKNDWVNAISNLGGLIAFSSYFFSLFTRLKEKYGNKLLVGIVDCTP